ncbi:hypothetical protein [Caldalkalibacillus salinus]|uniref:hypothetical protein n=1 Tax=Caldalkalibacillus salinus TaxID=2803787 RepID=UPI001920535F|nr:hypothetical protein [Caldalkalibacillus salinus]
MFYVESEQQKEVQHLITRLGLWGFVYGFSYDYSQAVPKEIPDRTRKTLRAIAEELRAYEQRASYHRRLAREHFRDPAVSNDIKRRILRSIEVHFSTISDELEKH